MAFKASNPILADAYRAIRGAAFSVKNYSEQRSTLFANGGTEQEILATVDNLTSLRNTIQINSTVPGLVDYAKIQEDDPTYEIVTEYTVMLAAIDAVLAYVTANIPAPRTFTDVQLAPMKTLLDDVVLAIE